MKKQIVFLILLFSSEILNAWSNHGLGTWQSLYYIKAFSQSPFVRVEPLESFLNREKEGLETLLRETDAFLGESLPEIYPPLPEGLQFRKESRDLKKDFFLALRINPNTRIGYYVQEMPGIPYARPNFPRSEITTYKDYSFLDNINFKKIQIGRIQSPLYVLVTAVDEPDYGMDVGLYEDNGTDFGKLYGFGEQPFGDPQYEYSSQAPFHMGFYYEDPKIYSLASFLSKTYPEVRAYQFLRLSRFAFQRGNEYWGYRFLGWGLHYIQDLTQPYHARVLPNYTAWEMIRINIYAMIGFGGSKDQAVERASNRHTFIESYQYEALRNKMLGQNSPYKDSYLRAYREKNEIRIPEDIFSYPKVVARESSLLADDFDNAIEDYALEYLGEKFDYKKLPNNPSRDELNRFLIRLNRNFGYHTRTILSWAKGEVVE